MEVNYGQTTKTMEVYLLYVKKITYNEDFTARKEEIDLRSVELDEDSAQIEINEILDKYHEIYKINNPWKFKRREFGNKISYERVDKNIKPGWFENEEFEFWYEPAVLNCKG